MIRALLAAVALGQAVNLADPTVSTRRANVDTCAGGKACLDVKVVEQSGGGSSSSLVYIVDAGPPININPPASLPLPAGAATATKQDTGNSSLSSIDGKLPALVSTRMPVDPSGVTSPVSLASVPTHAVTGTFFQATQPVSAASLPLPSGASTETTLALIKAKTDNLDVALSSRTKPADSQTVTGSLGRTWSLSNGSDSIACLQSGVWSAGRTWTLGSGTDSIAAVQSGAWNIANISGTVSLPTGASTEATLAAIKAQTDKLAFTGPLLQTSASLVGTGGDGAILDGVNPLVKATVTGANAVKVDGSAVTQPVSLASAPTTPITAAALPLPSGAATDATLSQLLDGGIAQLGRTPAGLNAPIGVNEVGMVFVVEPPRQPLNPFLPRCNAVRKTRCQP